MSLTRRRVVGLNRSQARNLGFVPRNCERYYLGGTIFVLSHALKLEGAHKMIGAGVVVASVDC